MDQPSDSAVRLLRFCRRQLPSGLTELESALAEHGFVLPPGTGDMQEQFGGYVYSNQEIWGVAHNAPVWLPSDGFDFDIRENDVLISCTDSPLCERLWMNRAGHIISSDGQTVIASCFLKYVEQQALVRDAFARGHFHRRSPAPERTWFDLFQEVLPLVKDHPHPAASDDFTRCYLTTSMCLKVTGEQSPGHVDFCLHTTGLICLRNAAPLPPEAQIAGDARDTVEQRGRRGRLANLDEILAAVPNAPPMPGDER